MSLRIAAGKKRLMAVATSAFVVLAACASKPITTSRDQPQPCGFSLDKVAQVTSIRIAYRQYGPRGGAPMVLLAGTGQQLVDWPPALIDGLTRKGYRVTVFDNRDMGCSTHMTAAGPPAFGEIISAMGAGKPPPVAYTLETLADDTRGLMDALKIRKAHIVGVSQGAIVAEMFAAKYADRTLSLSAIAPNSGNRAIPVPADPKRFAGLPPAPPATAPLDTIAAYKTANSKALQSRAHPRTDAELKAFSIVDAQRSYDPDASARQSAAALVTPDLRPRLKTINVPTVVIQGDQDPLIPRPMAEDVANTIPHARLVMVSGMGHDLPDAVMSDLVAAITSVAHS
jgi:pimeloyl-ACP methyl ester carboxylesterase